MEITNIFDFLRDLKNITSCWKHTNLSAPWFRGQSDSRKSPIPSVLRENYVIHEFDLITSFRLKAKEFGEIPNNNSIDQWLFLAQHFNLPTRLLDWTESPLVALFFAVEKYLFKPEKEINNDSGIWIINPIELNRISMEEGCIPNTWTEGRTALENIKISFGTAKHPSKYPIAVHPSYVHRRVSSQKSTFTIHGTYSENMDTICKEIGLAERGYYLKYKIPRTAVRDLIHELNQIGITPSFVMPDKEGLAKELKLRAYLELEKKGLT